MNTFWNITFRQTRNAKSQLFSTLGGGCIPWWVMTLYCLFESTQNLLFFLGEL